MPYLIKHHKPFEKAITKIPKNLQSKIYRTLIALKSNPRKLPPNTTTLKGYKNVYRTRLGRYRLIYQINHIQKTIYIIGVHARGEVYKLISKLLHS